MHENQQVPTVAGRQRLVDQREEGLRVGRTGDESCETSDAICSSSFSCTIGRWSGSSLVDRRCRVSQSSVSSPMRTCATPMRRRSLGRMVWTGTGFSITAPRFVAYSTGTSVPNTAVPACTKGSTSPPRKLTGVGISRTGDWQPASSVASSSAASQLVTRRA